MSKYCESCKAVAPYHTAYCKIGWPIPSLKERYENGIRFGLFGPGTAFVSELMEHIKGLENILAEKTELELQKMRKLENGP
jgi:hypothetical protein